MSCTKENVPSSSGLIELLEEILNLILILKNKKTVNLLVFCTLNIQRCHCKVFSKLPDLQNPHPLIYSKFFQFLLLKHIVSSYRHNAIRLDFKIGI